MMTRAEIKARIDLEWVAYTQREMLIQKNMYYGVIPEKSMADRETEYLSRIEPLMKRAKNAARAFG